MSKRAWTIGVAVGVLMAVAPGAHAKGAKEIAITGPGLPRVVLHGESHTGSFGQLSGFWYQAFQSYSDPTTGDTTATSLGPRYTARYLMAAPGVRTTTVVQYLYPYALPQPQTYVAAGQPVLGQQTKGGWYRANDQLVTFLRSHGLPRRRPSAEVGDMQATARPSPRVAAATTVPPAGAGPWWLVGVAVLLMCALLGVAVRVRSARSGRAAVT